VTSLFPLHRRNGFSSPWDLCQERVPLGTARQHVLHGHSSSYVATFIMIERVQLCNDRLAGKCS
jgi:hypothetical protein